MPLERTRNVVFDLSLSALPLTIFPDDFIACIVGRWTGLPQIASESAGKTIWPSDAFLNKRVSASQLNYLQF